MLRSRVQVAATLWALLCAALLAVVQFGGFPHPPLVLFVVFAGVWLFGAAMLWWFPLFGGIGTAAYGAILAVDLITMHGRGAQNDVLAASAVVAVVLALVVVRRRRGA